MGAICFFLLGSIKAQTVAQKTVKPVAFAVNFARVPDSVTTTPAAMAAYLVAHNKSQVAILKSLYSWMSDHISYDMVNTFKPDYYKDTAEAINNTLKTRIAVCQGYASLFMDICRRANIPAWLVSGYTLSAGRPNNASHVWVAVFTENKWLLTDPTWGSGYARDNEYVQQINWQHFLIAPAVFIKTHVPFDPLFQFQDQPLRHDEIRDGKWTAGSSRPVFNYRDTLAAYALMPELARAENSVNRITQYGITNQLISVELTNLHNTIAYSKQKKLVDEQNQQAHIINQASSRCNDVINSFNRYIIFRNNQYTPAKSDKEIREWVDGMATELNDITKMLSSVNATEPPYTTNKMEIEASAAGLKQRIAEEQVFLTRYLKTGKLFRKTLFYKMNWR